MKSFFDVIERPVVTEKSTIISEQGKYVFLVKKDCGKKQIKDAVENIFNVKVEKINIINQIGKQKRFKGMIGKQSDKKKAIVSLQEGQTIDFTTGVK